VSEEKTLSLSNLLNHINPAELTDGAQALIKRAYTLAEDAHAGQLRKSDQPYIQHPLSVAYLLAAIEMDPDTIAAGLLHDVVEDTSIDLETIEKDFGADIANLVDGVTKLEKMEREEIEERFEETRERDWQPKHKEAESLRKMFIAMAEDIRVVIIKLADRLHNMRTLDSLSEQRRKSFAHETEEIFAPLASRLGIWQWKGELQDLTLKYLEKETHDRIATLIEENRPEREATIRQHQAILEEELDKEGIEARITGRPKHIHSIYNKMQRKEVPLEQVYDIVGLRVITNTIPDCYQALGIVHGLWKPIPGEFDDYIATPKDNGYQSLHTAVVGENGKTIEVQIRTQEMHRVAEYGVATHYRYKEGGQRDPSYDAKIAWMRSLMEWRREIPDANEFVNAMKTDIFQDRVYVFTPQGDIIDLPRGSTPIDFAYHIHTEVGHRCRGAKVNDKWVELDYQLSTGDRVKIVTEKQASPSRDWLNPALGYVKTSRARSKIRQWFRLQDREKNITQGRVVIERELKHLGLEQFKHKQVAELFDYKSLDDFYAAVGFGDITSQQITSKIAETQHHEEPELSQQPTIPTPQTVEGIQVQGTGGLMTRLAKCCNPLPGHEIIGYVTRGKGVSIHRRDCPNVLRIRDHDRLIEVDWGIEPPTVPATVEITAFDRTGLLHEIAGVISKENVNMASVNVNRDKNITTLYITLEINNFTQLSRILTKIESISNVTNAQRYTG
jgi:GTP pyrophosphokinase